MAGTECIHGNHAFFRASGSRSGHHELVYGYQCGDGDHWSDHADRSRCSHFTTAIRDTLQGDYVAGSAKALESLIKVAAIVVGAGLGMLMAGGFRL